MALKLLALVLRTETGMSPEPASDNVVNRPRRRHVSFTLQLIDIPRRIDMKKIFGLLLVLAVIAGPSVAQKVTIDYAHDFDFESIKTFQYVDTKESNAGNDLTDNRLRDAIVREANDGGLQQVDSNPDMYLTYHVTTTDNTVFNTTSYGYGGYGPGWGGYGAYGAWGYGYGAGIGMADSTTRAYTYTEGTLIIDAYDPRQQRAGLARHRHRDPQGQSPRSSRSRSTRS